MQGRPAEEICKVAGISRRTLFRWRRKFGGLKPFAVQALRELEQENRRLRREMAQVARAPEIPCRPLHPVPLRSDLGTGQSRGSSRQPAMVVGRFAALRVR
jgi:hypothetical protein